MRDEEVVEECGYVVEDRLCIEEELGEEGEVLRVELMLFAVNFVERVVVFCVDFHAGWRGGAERTCFLDTR